MPPASKKGERVALLLINSPEFVEAFFAPGKIGAVVVPLNWRLVADELEFILKDSGATRLVFDDDFVETVAELHGRGDKTDVRQRLPVASAEVAFFADDYRAFRDAASDAEPEIGGRDDDMVYIMYTSGTTGLPKGVMHTHNTCIWGCITIAASTYYRENDRFLSPLPMFHVGALTPITLNVYRGVTSVVMRSFDPVRVWELIDQEKITIGLAVPAMLNFMPQVPNLERYDFSQWRWCMSGAAPVPESLIEACAEIGIEVHQIYGLTESCGPAALIDPENALKRIGSTGKAFFHTDVRIVAPDGTDCPPDVAGEVGRVAVRGRGEGGRGADRGGRHQLLPWQARELQAAERGGLCRCAAAQPEWQDPKARIARSVPGAGAGLTCMDLGELQSRLGPFCTARYGRAVRVFDVHTMPGHAGFSYGFSVDHDDGVESWFIRLPPPNVNWRGTADVLRQVEVLNALGGTDVPHCSVRWSGADLEWFGCPHFVVQKLDGDVLRLGPGEWAAALSEERCLDMGNQVMTALAGIHKVDPRKAPYLGDAVPFAEDVARWDRFYERAADPECLAGVPDCRRRLLDTLPTDAPVGVFHGDFQTSNLFFDAGRTATPRLFAVIDWELTGIGATSNDVGWICTFSDREAWAEGDGARPAFLDPDTLVDLYIAAYGDPLPDLNWFRALAAYKFAIITGFNLSLHRRGKRVDPSREVTALSITPLIDRALDLLG